MCCRDGGSQAQTRQESNDTFEGKGQREIMRRRGDPASLLQRRACDSKVWHRRLEMCSKNVAPVGVQAGLEQEVASKAQQLEAAAARAAQLEREAASKQAALEERAFSAERQLAEASQRVAELERQYAADADAAENRLWRRHMQRQLDEVGWGG